MAISFGAFSAAAHAFADEACSPSVSDHIHDHSDAPHDCTNHADEKNTLDGICMDCHHCCASHAIVSSTKTPDILFVLAAAFIPVGDEFTGEYLFSLLRPPRTLA